MEALVLFVLNGQGYAIKIVNVFKQYLKVVPIEDAIILCKNSSLKKLMRLL